MRKFIRLSGAGVVNHVLEVDGPAAPDVAAPDGYIEVTDPEQVAWSRMAMINHAYDANAKTFTPVPEAPEVNRLAALEAKVTALETKVDALDAPKVP